MEERVVGRLSQNSRWFESSRVLQTKGDDIMDMSDLLEKWGNREEEYGKTLKESDMVIRKIIREFIKDLKQLRDDNELVQEYDRVCRQIDFLEEENRKKQEKIQKLQDRIKDLEVDIEDYKEWILDLERELNNERNNITFNTNEIEKDVAIRVLAEMVAEK